MSTVNTFKVESFTNSEGQVIEPGDFVAVVTTGYGHRVSTFTGKFEGVYVNSKDCVTGTRVGDVDASYRVREYCDDGEEEETKYQSKFDARGTWIGYEYVPTGRRYNWKTVTKTRKSTLQRNRIFKIITPEQEEMIKRIDKLL